MSQPIENVIAAVATAVPSLEAMEKPTDRELKKAQRADDERRWLRVNALQWAIEHLSVSKYEEFVAKINAGHFVEAYNMLSVDGVFWPWRKSQWDRWLAAEQAVVSAA